MSVLNREGNPASGLTIADFRATIGNKPANIVSVTSDVQPRRIVIVRDASGSMRRQWKTTQAVVEAVITSAPGDTDIALVAFNYRTYLQVPLTRDRKTLLDCLTQIELESRQSFAASTAMYDAILRSISLLAPSRPGDTLIVVGDGEDNASRASLADVERGLTLAQTRADVFFLRGGRYEKLFVKDALKAASRLAAVSGGEVAFVEPGKAGPQVYLESESKRSADLPVVAAGFHAQLKMLYHIEVEAGGESNKPSEWKLVLLGGAGTEQDSLKMTYPQMLAPCDSQAPAAVPNR